jgi:endonuclease-3 related protein
MRKTKTAQGILDEIYGRLLEKFGPQHWWPGESPFEVMVGAILTQNTNWGNVERAIQNLKAHKMLSPAALHKISAAELAPLIRPAGYFNVKARRLKNFIEFLFEKYGGNLKKMAGEPWPQLRHKLLDVNGVGPETADSILLYAFEKPVFVVDAYTRRMLYRHNLIGKDADYHAIQELFMVHLDHDVAIFNEYHALIVRLGKDYCRPKPACERCVLNDLCYSLISRCGHCHRALLSREKRITTRPGSRCPDCRD